MVKTAFSKCITYIYYLVTSLILYCWTVYKVEYFLPIIHQLFKFNLACLVLHFLQSVRFTTSYWPTVQAVLSNRRVDEPQNVGRGSVV